MALFSERVKDLRLNRGWTQDDLAEKLGVSRVSISKYEKNSIPDWEILIKIADLFNVTTDYLLGRREAQKHVFPDQEEESKYLDEIKALLKQGNLSEESYQSLVKFARFLIRDHNEDYNTNK